MVIKNMSRIQFEHLFTVSSKCVEKPVPLHDLGNPWPHENLESTYSHQDIKSYYTQQLKYLLQKKVNLKEKNI